MAADTVHIAQAGEYLGHWQRPHTISVEHLRQIVRNFTGAPVLIDYEHATQLTEPGTEVPAAGWITNLRVEGEDLYGDVLWTKRAEQMIDDDEYRFLSPVIVLEAEHRNTGQPIGAVLESVALTNMPFMQGMDAVTHSQERGQLGRLAPASAEAVLYSKGRQQQSTDDTTSSDPSHNDPSEPMADTVSSAYETLKNKLSGFLHTNSTEDLDILDETRQLKQRADEAETAKEAAEKELKEAQERIGQLEGQTAEQEEAAAEAQAAADEELLNSAVSDFKIKKSDREDYEQKLQDDPETTRAVLHALPKGVVKPGGAGAVEQPGEEHQPGGEAGEDLSMREYTRQRRAEQAE